MTQTIPDTVLDVIVQHRPHLAPLVASIRQHPELVPQLEEQLATAYLMRKSLLSEQETEYLALVAYGEPRGGVWERATLWAARRGMEYEQIRQQIDAGKLEAIQRHGMWYLRRDTA